MTRARAGLVRPATTSDGRRRRGERKRALILSRAIDIASTDGLGGLTIGRLAADLGISKGNVTVLFGAKQALQCATLDAAIEVFIERVVTSALRRETPFARLKALCEGWFSYVDERVFPGGCFLFAASNEYRARPGAIRDRVLHHRHAWHQLLTNTAKEACQLGELRRDFDIDQLVFELTAYQASANLSALLGDEDAFARARRTTRERIAAAAAPKPQRRGP